VFCGTAELNILLNVALQAAQPGSLQAKFLRRAEHAADSNANTNAIVNDVLGCLARQDNITWLLVLDNVDREYDARRGDLNVYDVKSYLPGADHRSVLIKTRIARPRQLGKSQPLGKVDKDQAQAILGNWHKKHSKAPRTVSRLI
jgi:hypothetical protein